MVHNIIFLSSYPKKFNKQIPPVMIRNQNQNFLIYFRLKINTPPKQKHHLARNFVHVVPADPFWTYGLSSNQGSSLPKLLCSS